jgi:hypothetical protein
VPNYLLLALETALAVFGIRSIYEQPKYEVVARVGSAEIRRYAPRLAAEVSIVVDNEERGRKQAFRLLAGYIFGQNREAADIAMTSPVATGAAGAAAPAGHDMPAETTGAQGEVIMRFFLPRKVTRDNAPVPNDARIKIVELPEETIAALTFSGRGTEATLAEKKRELVGALATSPWHAAEEPHLLFYDPPFTIPFLRRNEVTVRVRLG